MKNTTEKEENRMKEQRNLIEWIKAHKNELIGAGISISALIGTILLSIKNRDAIEELWKSLCNTIQSVLTHTEKVSLPEKSQLIVDDVTKIAAQHKEAIPHNVCKHIRNLPNGRHASAEKIATSLENGFELGECQTWVIEHTKGKGIAA